MFERPHIFRVSISFPGPQRPKQCCNYHKILPHVSFHKLPRTPVLCGRGPCLPTSFWNWMRSGLSELNEVSKVGDSSYKTVTGWTLHDGFQAAFGELQDEGLPDSLEENWDGECVCSTWATWSIIASKIIYKVIVSTARWWFQTFVCKAGEDVHVHHSFFRWIFQHCSTNS